jgi:phospholipase C
MSSVARKFENFKTDADAGKLPQVTFVSPMFTGPNRTDDHPHGDPHAAQKFVQDAFAAFSSGPQWQKGAFILTYDEWGGFFDHIKPPMLPDGRASANDTENFGQAGFRVPSVLTSPKTRAGYVDHTLYDHTSVLRFLEWRFLGAPPRGPGADSDKWFLTKRDRNANNLGEALLRDTSNPDVAFDVAVKIQAPDPACASETAYHDLPPTAFEATLESGYLERVGLRV